MGPSETVPQQYSAPSHRGFALAYRSLTCKCPSSTTQKRCLCVHCSGLRVWCCGLAQWALLLCIIGSVWADGGEPPATSMNTRCNGHSNVNAPGDLRLDARHVPQAQRHTHLERASLGLKSVRCVQWPQPGRRSAAHPAAPTRTGGLRRRATATARNSG